jgi:homoserine kinase
MALGRRRVVRAPASSANLGPGFDCFAAALDLQLEVEVVETGSFAVVTDLDIERGRDNLVVRGFAALADAEQFEFRIRSQIPLSGGLGSSAAAFVAGAMAADHIFELDADLNSVVTELEGHGDNVAASLLGGMVICADGGADRLELPTLLEAVLVVPDAAVTTSQARRALPAEVPMADAVANVAHAGLLVAGLATGNYDLIARGLADSLHQDRRAHLYPQSHELIGRAAELGALGATISGAGPTVLFWCTVDQTSAVVEALKAETAGWAEVMRVPFAATGADVVEV